MRICLLLPGVPSEAADAGQQQRHVLTAARGQLCNADVSVQEGKNVRGQARARATSYHAVQNCSSEKKLVIQR